MTQHEPQMPVRRLPTPHPMAFPAPALVAITDTNALAARACNAADNGLVEDLFTGLSTTGRSNTYISAHVPGELVERLSDVALGKPGLLAKAEHVLWAQIMPRVPVVDLAIRDYLHPRVRPLMRADPELPQRLRGDVDDVGTAALAEFLAPAVILSADSVFMRFGLASTVATTWLPTAYTMLKAAGFEATLTDAAHLLEFAGRIVFSAVGTAWNLARRNPLPALSILAGAVYLGWRAGYLSRERWSAARPQIMEAVGTLTVRLDAAFQDHDRARRALCVVEPYGRPTVEQLAARHLARIGRPLHLQALALALARDGYSVAHEELAEAVASHPAFRGDPASQAGICVGRPARPPVRVRREQVRHTAAETP